MSRKPNVLMITADHWAASYLGCAGHPCIQTPTLDQLAANGVRYSNAYSDCPVCIPARRTLMTGLTPRAHDDRVYSATMLHPEVPTLAQCFRDAGYQAYAVGKLHVYPQRDRIGFDDVWLAEEGRCQYGTTDDYQVWLAEQGFAGQEFGHGMNNNAYMARPWHLPEHAHVTNWATREMCRMIRRRDPTRPGLYYLSYCHPHPPLAPLQCYLDIYRDPAIDIPMPVHGDWVDEETLAVRALRDRYAYMNEAMVREARRAFYALCTHIDHQLRLVIGTLREEGILENTVILFTSDHGDVLGNHDIWAKRTFYEDATCVPMLLSDPRGEVPHHTVDNRLVTLADVMPTLLGLAGLPTPEHVEGMSMVGDTRREAIYGEVSEGPLATRMIREGAYKLIYYPVGNRVQLFNIDEDPGELRNLADAPEAAEARARLEARLIEHLYKGDEAWAKDGKLVGLPNIACKPDRNWGLDGQRGLHWPPPRYGPTYDGEYA